MQFAVKHVLLLLLLFVPVSTQIGGDVTSAQGGSLYIMEILVIERPGLDLIEAQL